MRFPRFSLVFWSIVNAVLLAVLVALENGVGEKTAPTALLLYLPQHLFGALTIALLVASAWRKNWRVFALNGLVFGLFCGFLLGFRVPLGAHSEANSVRVVTWNIAQNPRGTAMVAREIRALNPDIVCLQETTAPLGVRDQTDDLLAFFPGWTSRRAREVTTLSRFPLLSSQSYAMPLPFRRKLLETRWNLPRGELTVFNAHIATTARGAGRQGRSSNLFLRAASIARHAAGTAQTRAAHLPIIDAAISQSKTPFLLAGDFNNPPRGYFHRHLSARMSDAFAASGFGLGQTYPASFPLLRIDYLWLGPGLRAKRCFVPNSRASDHLPVVSDVIFAFQGSS